MLEYGQRPRMIRRSETLRRSGEIHKRIRNK